MLRFETRIRGGPRDIKRNVGRAHDVELGAERLVMASFSTFFMKIAFIERLS